MVKLLRLLLLVLCDFVYSVAVDLYSVFYEISSKNIFSETSTMQSLENIYNNLYTLISLVMLFAFAVKLIQAIVNPEILMDQKKGVASIFKRAIIGLGLIVATPFLFKIVYDVQASILENNTIQKLIIGRTINTSGSEDSNGCRTTDPGQMIAGAALYSFLYPTNSTISVSSDVESSAREYSQVINCNVKKLSGLYDSINEKTNGEFVFHFDGFCALGIGILLVYFFVLFCMDSGLRLVKLIFLQLMAPVIIMAYILTNDDTLLKYLKEVGSTFAQVFARIAALAFFIFILSNINSTIIQNDNSDTHSMWFNIFLIIGALQFVKLAPDLINKLLGTQIQRKGGIKGRLGEMAAVGGLAQKAWHALPRVGALGLGLAGAGAVQAGKFAGKGIGWLGRKGANGLSSASDKVHDFNRNLAENGVRKTLGTGVGKVKKGLGNTWGALTKDRDLKGALSNGAGKVKNGLGNTWEALTKDRDLKGALSNGAEKIGQGARNRYGNSDGKVAFGNVLDRGLSDIEGLFKLGGRTLKLGREGLRLSGEGLSGALKTLSIGKDALNAAVGSASVLGAVSAAKKGVQGNREYQRMVNSRLEKDRSRVLENMGFDPVYEQIIPIRGADGNIDNAATLRKVVAGYSNGESNLIHDFKSEDAKAMLNYTDAIWKKNSIDALNSQFESINSSIDSAISFLNDNNYLNESNVLSSLNTDFKKGKINELDITNYLESLVGGGKLASNISDEIEGNLEKFNSDKIAISADARFSELISSGIVDMSSFATIKSSATNLGNYYDNAKTTYEEAKSKAKEDSSKGDEYVRKMDSRMNMFEDASTEYATYMSKSTKDKDINPDTVITSQVQPTGNSDSIVVTPINDGSGQFITQSGIVVPGSATSNNNVEVSQGQSTTAQSADNSQQNNQQQTQYSTDNSDIISALDKINESVTNNTSTLDSAIGNAANKISDTTKTSMESAASAIIESDKDSFRKQMNFERSKQDNDPDNDQFQNE